MCILNLSSYLPGEKRREDASADDILRFFMVVSVARRCWNCGHTYKHQSTALTARARRTHTCSRDVFRAIFHRKIFQLKKSVTEVESVKATVIRSCS